MKFLEDILFKKNSDILSIPEVSSENKISCRHDSSNEKLILTKFIEFSNTINLNHNVSTIIRLPAINSSTIKINLNPIENFQNHSNVICINNQESFEFFHNNYSDFSGLKDIWKKLEEAVCVSNFGNLPSIFFKPQMSFFDSSNAFKNIPTAFCNEFIEISFKLVNVLKINLTLKDCVLLWRFEKQKMKENKILLSNNDDNDENFDCVETRSIDQILIASKSEKIIRLLIKPKESDGNLFVLGMKYKLGINNNDDSAKSYQHIMLKQFFEFKDKTLNTKKNFNNVGKSINFKIVRKMPLLQVCVSYYLYF